MTYKESLEKIKKKSGWHTASDLELYTEGFLQISDKMLDTNNSYHKPKYVYVDIITYKLFLGRMLLNRNYKF